MLITSLIMNLSKILEKGYAVFDFDSIRKVLFERIMQKQEEVLDFRFQA